MTKVLITGVNGALGSNLILELIKNNPSATIIGIDKSQSINPVLSEEIAKTTSDQVDQFKYYRLDITQKEVFMDLLMKTQPDFIIHLAADLNVTRDFEFLERSLAINYFPILTILKYINKYEIKRVLLTGTCEEYGFNEVPYDERQQEQPVSPYSFAKTLSAVTTRFVHLIYNMPIVFLRPFTFFGPYQSGNMFIPSLFRAILRKEKDFSMSLGEQIREFNYAPDIAKAYVKALDAPKIDGEILNLGRGIGYKLADVADIIKKITDSGISLKKGALPYRDQELLSIITNTNKTEELLGWKASSHLENSLKETYNWYRKHPDFLY